MKHQSGPNSIYPNRLLLYYFSVIIDCFINFLRRGEGFNEEVDSVEVKIDMRAFGGKISLVHVKSKSRLLWSCVKTAKA